MERLTDRYSDGTAFIPEHIKQRFGMQSAINLLAAYEDLDLMPEQIKQMDVLYREKCEEVAKYKKLELEEQGLLLKLPCKVGDTLWQVAGELHECTVIYMEIYKNKVIINAINDDIGVEFSFDANRVGERYFLTREEAEQRLAKMRGELDAE